MKSFLKLVKGIVIVAIIGVILYKIYQYFVKDDMYETFEDEDEDFDLDSEEVYEGEAEEQPSIVDKVMNSIVGVVDSVSSFLSEKIKKA